MPAAWPLSFSSAQPLPCCRSKCQYRNVYMSFAYTGLRHSTVPCQHINGGHSNASVWDPLPSLSRTSAPSSDGTYKVAIVNHSMLQVRHLKLVVSPEFTQPEWSIYPSRTWCLYSFSGIGLLSLTLKDWEFWGPSWERLCLLLLVVGVPPSLLTHPARQEGRTGRDLI